MGINKSSILFFIVVLLGCNKSNTKNLDKAEFVEEMGKVNSNYIDKTIGDITYRLIYKPADYVLVAENKGSTDIELKELAGDYKKFEYYTLEIMINGFNDEILKYKTESQEQYASKVDYYSFKFQNDISELIGNDTVLCTSYHFERNYGISPKIRFNIAFPTSELEADRTICINEKYLGTGPVKFVFSKKDLDNLPTLNLNK